MSMLTLAMETRKYEVRVSYHENAYRSAELEIEVAPGTDPLEAMSVEELGDLQERVIRADPVMKLDDDEDDGFGVQIDIFDNANGESYSLDLVDGPQFLTQKDEPSTRIHHEVKEDQRKRNFRHLHAELKNDPVFLMSRGSGSELLHSNFLAWILKARQRDALPIFLDTLGIDVDLPMPCKVRREWSSFDLAVEIGKTDLVMVLHKFKTMPSVSQLRTYAETAREVAGGRALHLVLLSPTEPQWPEDAGISWNHIPYDVLLNLLDEVNQIGNDKFERELIAHYGKTVRRLLELREILLN